MHIANQSLQAGACGDQGYDRIQQVDVAGNQMTIFEQSAPLLDAMLADIVAARKRVWLETYTFAMDDAGIAIAAALAARARAGLDVRIIYDSVGSFSTPFVLFSELATAGARVHGFHSLRETFWKLSFLRLFNQRNHRKLLIVDDQVAYFGGMNIVDQRGIHEPRDLKARHLPTSAGWRDVHVRMRGPRQSEVAEAFDRLWRKVHRKRPRAWPRWPIDEMVSSRDDGVWFFDCRPSYRYRRAQRVFVSLIRQARESITLSMAYFIPVGRVLRALLQAHRRGVRIDVIVPGESDVKAVQYATRHFYEFLLKRGIHIYERKDCMLHSKAMVIDGLWTLVGSCNLDPRSLRLNLEFLATVRSHEMASAVGRICDFERERSQKITLADWHERTWTQKLVDRAAWSLRRWL